MLNNKIKTIVLIWCCVYPLVNIILLAINSLELNIAHYQKTLILTLILVPTIVLFVAPSVNKMITNTSCKR